MFKREKLRAIKRYLYRETVWRDIELMDTTWKDVYLKVLVRKVWKKKMPDMQVTGRIKV